jgi:hypothetical protein
VFEVPVARVGVGVDVVLCLGVHEPRR